MLKVAKPGGLHLPIFGRRKSPPGNLSQRQRANITGQNFVPICPYEHRLPNTVDLTSVIGVIGNVNSSKSHYLAGLVYELIQEQPLRHLNIDVAYLGDEAKELEARVNRVYGAGEILPNTEAGVIGGPYSYRLTSGARSDSPTRHVLSLFDVAGEDCIGLTKSAEFVRYLFNAQGIVLLIDPGGIPNPARPLSSRGSMPLTTRAVVDGLADAMEAVTGLPSPEQPQTIVITLAKADMAELPGDLWPPTVLSNDSDDETVNKSARRGLREYSARCRRALIDLGARGIVEAAETRFDRHKVFFAAVSATGEEPFGGRWSNPRPIGCSIPLALILMAEGY
jgi:hypothetical protein